jgi:2-oxoglutarate ferredoxin oxidoreductase subunit alpha
MSVLLKSFEHILVPEMNMGQLKTVLRDHFLVDAKPLNKVSGHPFRIAEIEAAIEELAGAANLENVAPRQDFSDFKGAPA